MQQWYKNLLVLILLWIIPNSTLAETIIADLSTSQVVKSKSFKGHEIIISGYAADNRNIVIIAQGPQTDYRVWKKAQVYGLWLNHEYRVLSNIPSFYFVAASGRLPEMMSHKTQMKYNLDLRHLHFPTIPANNTPEAAEFLQRFYEYKQSEGLYPLHVAQIERIGQHLFRSYVYIPESAVTGTYRINLYQLSRGKAIGQTDLQFELMRSPLDNNIDITAHSRPLYYAAFTILIALTAGALAGYMFRNDK